MTRLRQKFPPKDDLLLVFGGCAFIIHLWALFNLFYTLPAWALRLKLTELSGAVAYVLGFALLETVFVWSMFTCAAILLPNAWLRESYLTQSTALLLLTTVLAIVLHLNYATLAVNLKLLAGVLILYLFLALGLYFWIRHAHPKDTIWRKALQMTSVPAALYIFLDLAAVVLIVIRNTF